MLLSTTVATQTPGSPTDALSSKSLKTPFIMFIEPVSDNRALWGYVGMDTSPHCVKAIRETARSSVNSRLGVKAAV